MRLRLIAIPSRSFGYAARRSRVQDATGGSGARGSVGLDVSGAKARAVIRARRGRGRGRVTAG